MAAIDVRARTASRRLRRRGGPTFIARSREVSSEEKAMYHNVLGAGRRRVIRAFFGLSDDEKQVIAERVAELIRHRLEQQRST
jgi:hypothetical protein